MRRARVVGIMAAPRAANELAAALRTLADRTALRLPDAEWTIRLVSGPAGDD